MATETKAKKVAPLSETANEILEVLKGATEPMTLAQIKTLVPTANSAHLTGLRNRELVSGTEVEVEVVKVSKAKVLQYSIKGE